jgi:hypothetical protein
MLPDANRSQVISGTYASCLSDGYAFADAVLIPYLRAQAINSSARWDFPAYVYIYQAEITQKLNVKMCVHACLVVLVSSDLL